MHTRTFRCQSRIETFRLWGAEIGLFPKKFTYSFTSPSVEKKMRCKRGKRERRREKRKNSSEKSVCFFTALDFIFESIFFAPTVTHC